MWGVDKYRPALGGPRMDVGWVGGLGMGLLLPHQPTPGVAGQWAGGRICAELTGFRWGPTGPPVLLGRGSPLLSSSSRPPSCFPR